MPDSASPLAGKSALVTGAAVRVGRAIALSLAGAGADLAVHYRSSKSSAEKVAGEIRAMGRHAAAFAADLARPEECRRLVAAVLADRGGLDFLVHSAATFHRASLQETSEDLWDSAMNVNARAGFLLAREAASALRQRGGRVV